MVLPDLFVKTRFDNDAHISHQIKHVEWTCEKRKVNLSKTNNIFIKFYLAYLAMLGMS
jgi:hypothetical protein